MLPDLPFLPRSYDSVQIAVLSERQSLILGILSEPELSLLFYCELSLLRHGLAF